MDILFGYCCISKLHPKLRMNRGSTKTYLEQKSAKTCHDYLMEKAILNLTDLRALCEYNKAEHIDAFRVPEQLLPQIDLGYYSPSELDEELKKTGQRMNQYNIQLSTHPSQYFVLNSMREEVVEKTIHSLDCIADTLERMELDKIPNITLHLGMKKQYDSITKAIHVFCKNYNRLSQAAKDYLVLENDHVSFSVEDCMKVHEQIGIPIVFDNKHYEWNPGSLTYQEAVKRAVHTWKDRIPKVHLSSDKESKKHAHDDYVRYEDYERLASTLLETSLAQVYIMLECKEKDKAVLTLKKEIKEHETKALLHY